MKSYTYKQWNEMKAPTFQSEAEGKQLGGALAILVGLLIIMFFK